MHSVVAVVGALVAAVGSGVLLIRCFRTPRGDLIAWSVGLLGLLVSLGAQAMGYVSGFDGAIFRAMELGGQVVAPMAFLVALAEVAGRSALGRFCSRLYIGALGLVAFVVLALDQLTTARFSKAFPPAATFYQEPPNYLIMYAIGPVTALVAVITIAMVLARSGRPGWRDAVAAQLLGGVAALALAYPGLAELASHHVKFHVPLGSVFAILCTLAAALGWLAGLRSAALPLAELHGQAARADDRAGAGRGSDRATTGRYRDGDGSDRARRYDRAGRYDRGNGHADADDHGQDNGYPYTRHPDSYGEGGVYRGGGLYREQRPGRDGADRRRGDDWADSRTAAGYAEFATGDILPADFAAAELHRDDADQVLAGGGWQSPPEEGDRRPVDDNRGRAGRDDDRRGTGNPAERGPRDSGRRHEDDDPAERRRAELFGQITIYTLLEDRLEAFDTLTERVVAQVRKREPDTLVFIVHAVPSAPAQRILYQVYRSRAAYQRHLEQPYIHQFDLDRRPLVLATNVVELGLQQAKVSPFPSVAELFPEPGYDTSGFERPDYQRDYGRNPAQPGGGRRGYR